MFCFKYRKLLMPYTEGALDDANALRLKRHLASCERCVEELRLVTSASQALRQAEIPSMEPAADLWSKVRGAIQEQPSPAPFWRVRSLQAASAVAAATVLILFVAHSPFGPGQIERAQQSAPLHESRKPSVPKFDKPTVVAGTSRARSAAPSKELKFGGEPSAQVAVRPQALQPDILSAPEKPVASRVVASPPAEPSPPILRDEYVSDTPAKAGLDAAKSKDEGAAIHGAKPAPPTPASLPRLEATVAGEEKAATADEGGAKFSKETVSGRGIRAKPAPVDPALLKARGELSAQLTKTPDDVVTITKLAEVEERLGNKADALKWRKKLTELRPKEAYRWVDLGRSYEANAQPKNALPAYKKAISLGLTGSLQAETNDRIQKLTERGSDQ